MYIVESSLTYLALRAKPQTQKKTQRRQDFTS